MGLPILLNHRPVAWRSNPLVIPIRCWADKAKKVPVDLAGFGTTWLSQVRVSYDGALIATFTVTKVFTDDSVPVNYGLDLTLPGSVTAALTEPVYLYDVEVTGGALTPLTVFRGTFLVDGDITRGP